ncbi:precorrin-6y C5,15-methyltransferase (decarboxylating) subunit CbiE [Actinomadura hibisca]|uniref:precorrin-6y C5,15-methyltransferase (decarboxylating) subunit CbiE n=1 Tax=Actinomadura hibisca TaxID=68565 RepID=UPI00082B6F78|nr:precorrin-6y C5,15-methyltransferase (decarboxylating) subunit CbiE [Actinomadura hibisca]
MITVVGYDGAPLPEEARRLLAAADLVTGDARVLAAVDLPSGARVGALEDIDPDAETVVLAAGDPGFFGVVRTLRERGHRPRVLPAVSVVARAFARAGFPWDDALVVSAGEGGLRRAVNACRAHPKVAVLTAPDAGPAELARALFPQSPRAFVVCEDLGGPAERVVHVRPAEATTRPWNQPEVVLVLDATDATGVVGWTSGPRPFPEIPTSEIAAVVLARLAPRVGDLVWDVDGDGTVAIACARAGAAAVAVARDPQVCETIRGDIREHGVKVAVSRGEPPTVFEHLPVPDAVFLGDPTPAVVRAAASRVLRCIVATTTDEQAVRPILNALQAEKFTAQAVRLQATPFDAPETTPTFVITGERTAPATERPRRTRARRPQTITPLPEEPSA